MRAPRVEKRERRLHRVDVADRPHALELLHVEVGDADPARLALLHERRPSSPTSPRAAVPVVQSGQWNWYRSIRSTPRRRRLRSHSSRIDSGRRSFSIIAVRPSLPAPAALREHEDFVADAERAERPPDDLLGMPEPVDRGGVDPVHARARPRDGLLRSSRRRRPAPQPKRHGPPIAQAPNPTVESSGPVPAELPRLHVRARPSSSR